MKGASEYFVCDLRREWRGQPYITFWRPKNSNYAWPLAWSGRYRRDELQAGYHEICQGKTIERFPVPCELAERLAEMSEAGRIDGGQYLVVRNTDENRRKLRMMRITLESCPVAHRPLNRHAAGV